VRHFAGDSLGDGLLGREICETLSGITMWLSRIDEVIDKEFGRDIASGPKAIPARFRQQAITAFKPLALPTEMMVDPAPGGDHSPPVMISLSFRE